MKREIEEKVEKGSVLFTDGHSGYDSLDTEYVRLVIEHAEKYVRSLIYTNGIENFWTLLKRSLTGAYVNVEPCHLFRYVVEQEYRFNYRDMGNNKRFVGVLSGVSDRRITYKQLTGKVS